MSLAIGLAASTLAGCGFLSESFPTYRYRLTIEVDTPIGLRSGASVIEVRTSRTGKNFPASPNQTSYRIKGEAVAVDLPGGQTLFGVLQPDSIGSLMIITQDYLQSRQQGDERAVSLSDKIESFIRTKELLVVPRYFSENFNPPGYPRPSSYPDLVRFIDPTRPDSVLAVDPDNLTEAFGPSVRLRRITAQVTDDPVTVDIVRRLPWLPEYARREARLNGKTDIAIGTNEPSDRLGPGSFSAGLEIAR